MEFDAFHNFHGFQKPFKSMLFEGKTKDFHGELTCAR